MTVAAGSLSAAADGPAGAILPAFLCRPLSYTRKRVEYGGANQPRTNTAPGGTRR